LFVPVGGAPENVKVVPETPYVDAACLTPEMVMITAEADTGARERVNATVVLLPLK
jgi:hypothetical protein